MGQVCQPISRPGCAESGLIGGNYILLPSQDEYYARTEITNHTDDWMSARDVGWDWMSLRFFFHQWTVHVEKFPELLYIHISEVHQPIYDS